MRWSNGREVEKAAYETLAGTHGKLPVQWHSLIQAQRGAVSLAVLKPCTAAVAKALIEPLGAVHVTLKYRHGDHSVSRDLGNVPRVCRGRGSQREARAAAWEAVCEK